MYPLCHTNGLQAVHSDIHSQHIPHPTNTSIASVSDQHKGLAVQQGMTATCVVTAATTSKHKQQPMRVNISTLLVHPARLACQDSQ
jgi:hypothetical protein